MSLHRSGYGALDDTGQALKYVERLDAMRASGFWRSVKERSIELLELGPGDHVLDVGCGTGDDVRDLAGVVGDGGQAVGVDMSAAMIEEARQRNAGRDLSAEFHVADATCLPFSDSSFDACRAERVLQHLEEPNRALAEMVRVVRPGGRIACVEPDYATLAVAGGDGALTHKILRVRCEHFRNGRIGSQLAVLSKRLGLQAVTVQLKTLATNTYLPAEQERLRKYAEAAKVAAEISAREAEEWLAQVDHAGRTGRYRHAVTIFVVSGRKA